MKKKMKRRSAAKKRFKLVGNNKIKRAKAYRRHLLTHKSAKRRRGLRKRSYVSSADSKRIAELLR